ncbi:DNA polymerase IV [Lacihabitans sp. CS3-21]|jgi:DNA polymerase-4|uniref:DNA polymerase IV n=1 Tax=Lacihabitans sp. CS3-21 TaxID=2487332 RepID=UPI000BCDFD9D|nr:DNA polymerase IV [Lacihabitans sp. CS3-21]MCP9746148.1 DNA polymerase IV [Lacihabitans sp. CS3-21]MDP1814716.1 DNA polymerase IV [Leadbetterella sp.]OYU66017.1 MAG: DNA polymerase IV [Cytophagaceae bacterium BCCC1]
MKSATTRTIAHFDLDSFFVSVERIKNPSLIGKPVIVGGMSERGVVAACSYEARAFGVSSAMPGKMAKRLCPDAIWIRGDFESYVKYSDMVTNLMESNLPLLEKASIDEFYADLTGMDKYFGSYKYATELRQRVKKDTGLTISLGMSSGKTISKVATNECKPNNQKLIPIGEERSFLSPLAISKMPMIGKVTGQQLRNMGITSIGMLAEMPKKMVQAVLGQNGVSLWDRANGIDNSPVVPYHDQKSMSKEMTFDKDTTDVSLLRSILVKMTEELCYDLRRKNRCVGQLSVKIRYSNFDTHLRQLSVSYTANDDQLQEKALEIFEKLYDRRLLIRLIGVKFGKLVPGYSQITLFDKSAHMADLYQAMDRIRHKHGIKAVGKVFGMQMYERRKETKVEGLGLPPEKLRKMYQ